MMSRSSFELEQLREVLITSTVIPTTLKLKFIRDYYDSNLSDSELYYRYHNVVKSILY